ncbi:peroxidase-related enzyme [Mycolicibacterium sp.]|uniref:peroxidase-related enzyme n=1 Tax=Mycolicibacterium sp. TaxID=2320850 RepID=UPI003D1307E1
MPEHHALTPAEAATLAPGRAPGERQSRLHVPADTDIPPPVLELADSGHQSRSLRAWGLGGDTTARFLQFVEPLMDPDQGHLSIAEREFIATVVSAANRCVSCTLVHGQALGEHIGDHGRARRIAINYRTVPLSRRERALGDLAANLTEDLHRIDDADFDRLRDCGLSDAAIFEAVAVTAAFNFTNRVVSALGTQPDPEFFTTS